MEDKKISLSVSKRILSNFILIFIVLCLVSFGIWRVWSVEKRLDLHEETLLRLLDEDLRFRTYLQTLDPNFETNMAMVEEVLQAKTNK